jgi:hypothetical protein
LASDVYLATLEQSSFWQHYESNKQEKLGGLIQICRDRDQHSSQYLDFQLAMIQTAMNQTWRLPALVVKHQGRLIWHTGGIRLLATGLCQTSQDLKILVQDFDRVPDPTLKVIEHINHDRDLSRVLGVDYHVYDQQGKQTTATTGRAWLEWHDQAGPVLHYFDSGDRMGLDWANHSQDLKLINGYIEEAGGWAWPRPLLYWSEHPDQVRSSSHVFDLRYQGPPPLGPGLLDQSVYHAVCNVPNDAAARLWVRPGRKIDADELLFWVNSEYNVYHDWADQFAFLISTNHRMDSIRIRLSNHA